MVAEIDALFPGLQSSGYRVTSSRTLDYNCIAWAAGDTTRWWWPDPDPNNAAAFWPAAVSRQETVSSFLSALGTIGFTPCADDSPELGFEKVALFALNGIPTHAARQLANGRWTSKIGALEDIEHTLHELSGGEYGSVVQVLRRAAQYP